MFDFLQCTCRDPEGNERLLAQAEKTTKAYNAEKMCREKKEEKVCSKPDLGAQVLQKQCGGKMFVTKYMPPYKERRHER